MKIVRRIPVVSHAGEALRTAELRTIFRREREARAGAGRWDAGSGQNCSDQPFSTPVSPLATSLTRSTQVPPATSLDALTV